jgi:hypothetical protein
MRGRPARTALLLAIVVIVVGSIAVTSVPLVRQYREWRSAVAIEQYDYTTNTALPYATGLQTDRLVVLSPGPVRLTLWGRSLLGRVGFRLTSSDGREHLSLSSTRFAWDGTVELAPGSYGAAREFRGAFPALFVAGIAGDVTRLRWPPERVTAVEPRDSDEFAWRFYLYIPAGLSGRTVPLAIAPNDTGMAHEQYAVHDAHAMARLSALMELAEAVPAPLLVPAFPRIPDPSGANPHALDRQSLAVDRGTFERVDRQLVAMGERAEAELALRGIDTESRWLLFGTGAAGLFVNRFAFLHPERVAVAVAEIPGGWPLTPIEPADSDGPGFPASSADLDEFATEPIPEASLRSVRHVLFTFEDTEGSLVDALGRDAAEEVAERFGTELHQRWAYAELAYAGFGMESTFELLDEEPPDAPDEVLNVDGPALRFAREAFSDEDSE